MQKQNYKQILICMQVFWSHMKKILIQLIHTFFEAFDVYNIPNQKRKNKGLGAFQFMILSKIVGDHLEEVNNVVLSKQGKDYYGKEVEA